jgi:hypothetical protein
MIERRKAAELVLPWAGIIGAGIGWFLTQQIGANLAHGRCDLAELWVVALLGLIGLGLALGGALLALKVWRRGEAESEARRFLALLSAMLAGLLSVAILFQTVAGFLLPQCFG